MDDLSEYKGLYLQTGKEYVQLMNADLLKLEKNPADKEAIAGIFDSAHSLKSQSAAMGYQTTGLLCHIVEDIFFEIKEERLILTHELADHLFSAFDGLKSSLETIEKENKEVDMSEQTETLKKLTGVNTAGVGKSQRNSETELAPTSPIVNKDSQEKENEKSIENSPSEPKTETKTIAVKVERLDEIMNLMEELLVYRLHLKKITHDMEDEALKAYYNATSKITDDLQYKIMQVRTIPLKVIFDHYPRAIRDVARIEEKEAELKIVGEDLELDRSIVDKLDEPLIHLLRNAVSHGIEKSGTITLSALREKEYAAISVKDDGVGIDWQKLAEKANVETKDEVVLKKLLFSGISTAEKVTQVSGRGVGLGVVKKMVESFGGRIEVLTEKGKGTTFTIKLPLTLAVTKTLLVKVGHETYAIPAVAIDRSLKIKRTDMKKTANQEVFVLDKQEIPLLRLSDRLGMKNPLAEMTEGVLAVIVESGDEKIGLIVDKIMEASEVIIKPVPAIIKMNTLFSGTTILGDGKAAFIINTQGLV